MNISGRVVAAIGALLLAALLFFAHQIGYSSGVATEKQAQQDKDEKSRIEHQRKLDEERDRADHAEALAELERDRSRRAAADFAVADGSLRRQLADAIKAAGAGKAQAQRRADATGPDWLGAFAACQRDYGDMARELSGPLDNLRGFQNRERALIPSLEGLFPAPPIAPLP